MKTFVLDTNVLLYDPQAIFKFEENDIIIPITVIEEIDRFKKDMNETGRNARQVSRILDQFRKEGSLSAGVRLESGGMLRVEIYEERTMKRLPPELREERGDNRILAVAVDLKEKAPDTPVILVTKDTNLRIKADAIGLVAQDYRSDKVEIEDLYSGMADVDVTPEAVDRFHGQGWLEWDGGGMPNQFLTLRDAYDWDPTALLDVPAAQVLGVEAAVWTETVRTSRELFLMLLPRLAGLADVGWAAPENRDWATFRAALPKLTRRWEALGFAWYRPALDESAG